MKKELKSKKILKRKEMKSMKNNSKGITLIALIITIIVMLILVAVTINVALNGGLFEQAKNAADRTQKEAEKEELMTVAFGTLDNKGNLNITETDMERALSQGWNVDDENTITDAKGETWYPCESPKGNTYYLNTKTGKIRDVAPTPNPNPNPDPNPDPDPDPDPPVPGQDWPESEQVNDLVVGNILICNGENWIVLYNDNTAGLQLVKQKGIQYAGSTITTKNSNNEFDAAIAKASYNTITKTMSDYCAAQNYGLPSTWGIRCAGSPELAPEKDISELTNSDYYTYRYPAEGDAQLTITASEEIRKGSESGDMTPLMSVLNSLQRADDSHRLLLPARAINVSSNGLSVQFYVPANDTDVPSLQGLRFYLKDSNNGTTPDPAVITAADNWTIFPVAIVETEGLVINATETPGTYTYSYSE